MTRRERKSGERMSRLENLVRRGMAAQQAVDGDLGEDLAARTLASDSSNAIDEATCKCGHHQVSHAHEGTCRECACDKFTAVAGPPAPSPQDELRVRVLAELEALNTIVRDLLPLAPDERARVLLLVALKTAPGALTDDQLMCLVRQGRNPNP